MIFPPYWAINPEIIETSPFWSGQENSRIALTGELFCTVSVLYIRTKIAEII